ncbi:MAG: hypothetical protein E7404_04680 [Ruminococcaceae bacterium]|nr:hypothetical protein [Oscillospiraceae bacterium]
MKKIKGFVGVLTAILLVVQMLCITGFAAKTYEDSVVIFDDAFISGSTVSDDTLIVTDEYYSGTSSFKVLSWKTPNVTFLQSFDMSDFIDQSTSTGGKISFYLKKTQEIVTAETDMFEINICDENSNQCRVFMDYDASSATNWTYYEIDLDSYTSAWYNNTYSSFDKTKVNKIEFRTRGNFTSYIDDIKLVIEKEIKGATQEVVLQTYFDEYLHIGGSSETQTDPSSHIWYSYGYRIEGEESTAYANSGEKSLQLTLGSGWQSYGLYGAAIELSDVWDDAYIKFSIKAESDLNMFVSAAYRNGTTSDNVSTASYTVPVTTSWTDVKVPMSTFTDFTNYKDLFSGVRFVHNSTANEGQSVYIDDFAICYEKEIPTLSGTLSDDNKTLTVSTSSEKGQIIVTVL